jgi:hypothetical protein
MMRMTEQIKYYENEDMACVLLGFERSAASFLVVLPKSLFVCLFIYLFVCLFICLFIYLFVYLFVCLFIYLFVYLFVYLFIYLFVYLFVYLFICLFIYLFALLLMIIGDEGEKALAATADKYFDSDGLKSIQDNAHFRKYAKVLNHMCLFVGVRM